MSARKKMSLFSAFILDVKKNEKDVIGNKKK
jgi:hypothetical protein